MKRLSSKIYVVLMTLGRMIVVSKFVCQHLDIKVMVGFQLDKISQVGLELFSVHHKCYLLPVLSSKDIYDGDMNVLAT